MPVQAVAFSDQDGVGRFRIVGRLFGDGSCAVRQATVLDIAPEAWQVLALLGSVGDGMIGEK